MQAQLTESQQRLLSVSFIDKIDQTITQQPSLESYRAPHLYPSSATVVDVNGKILGSCARKEFLRLTQVNMIEPYRSILLAYSQSVSKFDQATQQWIFAAGNMYEEAYVELAKLAGIFDAHHIKWMNTHYNISGELDILVKGQPFGLDLPFWVEMKSTDGYNNIKQVFNQGKPKTSNLLQTALYAHHFRDICVGGKLVYQGRGSVWNRKEFTITYHINNEVINGQEKRVARIAIDGELVTDWSINNIYERFAYIWKKYMMLDIPPAEFTPVYTDEIIKQKQASKELSKYQAANIKDPTTSAQGDFNCNYCEYKPLCMAISAGQVDMEEFRLACAKWRKAMHAINPPEDIEPKLK